MPSFATFTVAPSLPEKLAILQELARNLLWTWNHDFVELFQRIDRDLWERVDHNPVRLLGLVPQERFDELRQSDSFISHLERVTNFYHAYMKRKTWYQKNFAQDNPDLCIAYFSMEYGITEALPIYSGGLGVLSGDHLKSASDLGLPLVAIGLLYQEGYFKQYLNADGWQQERYPINDFYNMPIGQIFDENGEILKISVPMQNYIVHARIWKIQVGRIPLYLLDTNIPENSKEAHDITDKLYGGDSDMRIKQEIMLGIGGQRALHAMGIKPTVCHMNEGHAAFQVLERNRLLMHEKGVSYKIASQATAGGNVFTTHTPVPAGFDVFSPQQIYEYFKNYVEELDLKVDTLLRFGRGPKDVSESGFNMAIMAASHSPMINAVSKLHSVTSRRIFKRAFGSIPEDEIFITSITNGVHFPSWISQEMAQLFDRYLGNRWIDQPEDQSVWERVHEIPDEELWRTHERRRERLIALVRKLLHLQLARRGSSKRNLDAAKEALSPETLTIGFARRFATYKRATLMLRDKDRLKEMLLDKDRPIQFIFAGKAHPRDNAGKDFIRQIVHFARDLDIKRQIVFLEDYNISLARYMVQGIDIWLNTPRRPLEASGTSGMKVVPNGGLNFSTLDGWWVEGYDRSLGFSIGSGEEYTDHEYQDQVESSILFDLLEYEIIPTFYKRGRDGLPRQWITMMKNSMAKLGPVFNTHRMVMEYFERFYLKAHKRSAYLMADDLKEARELGEWRDRVRNNWESMRLLNVSAGLTDALKVGDKLCIQAEVDFGKLVPDDINVELYYGQLDPNNEIIEPETLTMELATKTANNIGVYEMCFSCHKSGKIGYTVRIIPNMNKTTVKHELLLINWADNLT